MSSSTTNTTTTTLPIVGVAEKKLVQTVEKQLQQAQRVSVIKQKQILAQLFLDLSAFIDPKYKSKYLH
jgi:deoxyinosine 3'endonuclease (endonuclease V)